MGNSIVVAENQDYPRVHVWWHDGHGFVVHCFKDGESVGFFLAAATSFSSPEIEIEMGGQALEVAETVVRGPISWR